jgi:hypothetical protein
MPFNLTQRQSTPVEDIYAVATCNVPGLAGVPHRP